MSYRRTDNSDRIIVEKRQKLGLAVRFGIEDMHRISRPKTPMKTGQLRGDVEKSVHGANGKITWGKHYAWYQERGYTSGKVRKYTTPGTGAHFAEDAAKDVGNNPRKYFRMAGL